MRRRPADAVRLVAVACLAGALACGEAAREAPGSRPDLLLITADDMGLELGAYGDPAATTPALDDLAREGMRFDAAFAAAPVCSPSRAALLTGLFPHANGHWGFPEDTRLRSDVRSVAELLGSAGYATGLVGKLHVASHRASDGAADLGFQVRVRLERADADSAVQLGRAVSEFLAGVGPRPFFLAVGTRAPHNPYPGQYGQPAWPDPHDPARVPVPPSIPDAPALRRLLARMYDAYALADSLVAAILEALEEAGRADSTLVLFTSDHGPALPGAKATLFDPGIHVPLLARWPGVVAAGSASAALVSGVDLAPTLLEAAGVPPPAGLHGRSLLPLLAGGGAPAAAAVFAEHTKLQGNRYFPQRAIRTARYKYVRNLRPDVEARFNALDHWARPLMQRWHVDPTARRLLERTVRHPREELYDLASDPHELRNLAGDPAYAETLQELGARLREWMRSTNDPWLALWDRVAGEPDPFEPRQTRDGPFRPLWLDDALAKLPGARKPG